MVLDNRNRKGYWWLLKVSCVCVCARTAIRPWRPGLRVGRCRRRRFGGSEGYFKWATDKIGCHRRWGPIEPGSVLTHAWYMVHCGGSEPRSGPRRHPINPVSPLSRYVTAFVLNRFRGPSRSFVGPPDAGIIKISLGGAQWGPGITLRALRSVMPTEEWFTPPSGFRWTLPPTFVPSLLGHCRDSMKSRNANGQSDKPRLHL